MKYLAGFLLISSMLYGNTLPSLVSEVSDRDTETEKVIYNPFSGTHSYTGGAFDPDFITRFEENKKTGKVTYGLYSRSQNRYVFTLDQADIEKKYLGYFQGKVVSTNLKQKWTFYDLNKNKLYDFSLKPRYDSGNLVGNMQFTFSEKGHFAFFKFRDYKGASKEESQSSNPYYRVNTLVVMSTKTGKILKDFRYFFAIKDNVVLYRENASSDKLLRFDLISNRHLNPVTVNFSKFGGEPNLLYYPQMDALGLKGVDEEEWIRISDSSSHPILNKFVGDHAYHKWVWVTGSGNYFFVRTGFGPVALYSSDGKFLDDFTTSYIHILAQDRVIYSLIKATEKEGVGTYLKDLNTGKTILISSEAQDTFSLNADVQILDAQHLQIESKRDVGHTYRVFNF